MFDCRMDDDEMMVETGLQQFMNAEAGAAEKEKILIISFAN